MKHVRDALIRAVRDAYRRRGQFTFVAGPDYPNLFDYYRSALGDSVARQLVKSDYMGLVLRIKGRMTPDRYARLLTQRKDLLRGSKGAFLSLGATHLRAWESQEARKYCIPEAKRLLREFAKIHGGKRVKGSRYSFDLGGASLVLLSDFGTYSADMEIDMLVPELRLRIPCNLAFCLRSEELLTYGDTVRFSENLRLVLRVIAALYQQVRSDCASEQAVLPKEVNPADSGGSMGAVVRKK